MSRTLAITNLCQRNESNFVDLITAFNELKIKFDFADFIKQKTAAQRHMKDRGAKHYLNSLSKSNVD